MAGARAVIFDYGGVVYAEDAADFDAVAARHGVAPGALWAAYHDLPEYGPSRRGELGRTAYRAGVVRELARVVGADRARVLVEEFERGRAEAAAVVPEMGELLARLRGSVKLGLLSNAGLGATARLSERGVAVLFDDVVCSGDVGLAKPDPAIFRLAARRLGVPPGACAFVDDQARHVEGARAAGMRSHLHHRSRMADLRRFLADVGALSPYAAGT